MIAPLNIIFPIDKEILNPEELAEITGRAHRQDQVAWLTDKRWQHQVNRRGDPIVGRLYARLKLAGVELAALQPGRLSVNNLPDFSKVR